MIVWRLTRRKHADPPSVAFSGIGAAKSGGRWNAVDIPVTYISSSRALAALEYLVHIDKVHAPRDLVFVAASVDENDIEYGAAPDGWDTVGSPRAESYGTQWAIEQRSLVLAVPSIVLPRELNYLINPRHPNFSSVLIDEEIEPFTFDARIVIAGAIRLR